MLNTHISITVAACSIQLNLQIVVTQCPVDQAEFTMEFLKYARVPQSLAEELIEKDRQKIEEEKR